MIAVLVITDLTQVFASVQIVRLHEKCETDWRAEVELGMYDTLEVLYPKRDYLMACRHAVEIAEERQTFAFIKYSNCVVISRWQEGIPC